MSASDAPVGAALPWGVVPSGQPAEEADEEEGKQLLTLEELGLSLGSRIEVCWNVEPDDGEPFRKWWGARIDRAGTAAGGEGGPSYVLAYDSTEGFDAEEREVQLYGEHDLRDVEEGDFLVWRKEGDDWEEPEEATLEDLLKTLPQDADLQAAEAEALSDMDAATQRRVAAGLRDMTDRLKEYLHEQMEAAAAKGDGPLVVTEGMVNDFMSKQAGRLKRRADQM